MPDYRRANAPGGTYFFTVALQDRGQRLLVDHVDSLRYAFATARHAQPFELVAIAILPEHLHCVWTLPPGDADNATRWSRIKREFSHLLPQTESRSLSRQKRRERGVWQRRFWERLITSEADLRAHVDYVHFNPVKHGLAAAATEWRYSSIHRALRLGQVDRGWGA